jgi:hypothetical protein
MKVRYRPFVESTSGTLGGMIFYQLDGQEVMRRKPAYEDRPTQRQLAQRQRVREAAKWSRKTMADPAQKAIYQAACHGHLTPYNLGVRDFLRPPVVESIDLDDYTGGAGQRLRILAWDDFEVTRVEIVIRDAGGNLIEQGLAKRGSAENEWEYWTQSDVVGGSTVRVEVAAYDRPMHVTQASRWQLLAPQP